MFTTRVVCWLFVLLSVGPVQGAALTSSHEKQNKEVALPVTPQAHRRGLQMLICSIKALISQNELPCASKQDTLRLLDQLEQKLANSSSIETNLFVARALAEHIIIEKTATIQSIQTNLSPLIETEEIIQTITKRLVERGISTSARYFRTLYDLTTGHPHLSALIAIPLGIYCSYKGASYLQHTYPRLFGASGDKPAKGEKCESAAENTLQFVSSNIVLPSGAIVLTYLKKDAVMETAQRFWDNLKKFVFKLQARPYQSRNTASPSKVSLQDAPLTASLKDTVHITAELFVLQEKVLNLKGCFPKVLLCVGDQSVGALLGQALAHEVTRVAAERGTCMPCPVATAHVAKFVDESFKEYVKKVQNYNPQAVIIVQGLDWLTTLSDEARSKVTSELITEIRKLNKPNEGYLVIGTAADASKVDPELMAVFGSGLSVTPATDPELSAACIAYLEQLFQIRITSPELKEHMLTYLANHSFADLRQIVHVLYTQSLPIIAKKAFNQETLMSAIPAA